MRALCGLGMTVVLTTHFMDEAQFPLGAGASRLVGKPENGMGILMVVTLPLIFVWGSGRCWAAR